MRRGDREITDREELLEVMGRCGVCRRAMGIRRGVNFKDSFQKQPPEL